MANAASSSQADIIYIEEVTPGVTPSTPTMLEIRLTSPEMVGAKETLVSNEVRKDRQTVTLRHGQQSVTGTPTAEAILGNADDWIEAAMRSDWAAIAGATDNIGITNPNLVVSSSASLVTDDFRPGDIIELASLAVGGEDGLYRVTVAAAGQLTLVALDGSALNLTTEAENATPVLSLKGSRADIGTDVLKYFTMEKRYNDNSDFEVGRGVTISTMEVGFTPTGIPTFAFGLLGLAFDPMTGVTAASVVTPATGIEAMSPIQGTLYEGGVAVATLTAATFTVDNGHSLLATLFASGGASPCVNSARANVTGSLSALFDSVALHNKFVNETVSTLWVRMTDPTDPTGFISLVIYRLKYTGSTKQEPVDGAVTHDMPWTALRDPATGQTFSIQRSNA